jgi:SAM-dependent methyltransferase
VDHEAYRSASRADWGAAAAGWQAQAAYMRRITMPVSTWLVDAARLQPGAHVLELAAGTGETGFLAAELIAPGGELICSDFVPEMLTAAQERATELGLANVRFKQIDAESIDLFAASQDAVLCRWGYMLMADPEAALRETRRILKPGGRVALAAWAQRSENPWNAITSEELEARGLAEPPPPDAPGPFRFGAAGTIEELLAGAGFVDEIEVEPLRFAYTAPDFDTWWAGQKQLSQRFTRALGSAGPETEAEVREAVRERAAAYTAEDGSLALPAVTWVAAATA